MNSIPFNNSNKNNSNEKTKNLKLENESSNKENNKIKEKVFNNYLFNKKKSEKKNLNNLNNNLENEHNTLFFENYLFEENENNNLENKKNNLENENNNLFFENYLFEKNENNNLENENIINLENENNNLFFENQVFEEDKSENLFFENNNLKNDFSVFIKKLKLIMVNNFWLPFYSVKKIDNISDYNNACKNITFNYGNLNTNLETLIAPTNSYIKALPCNTENFNFAYDIDGISGAVSLENAGKIFKGPINLFINTNTSYHMYRKKTIVWAENKYKFVKDLAMVMIGTYLPKTLQISIYLVISVDKNEFLDNEEFKINIINEINQVYKNFKNNLEIENNSFEKTMTLKTFTKNQSNNLLFTVDKKMINTLFQEFQKSNTLSELNAFLYIERFGCKRFFSSLYQHETLIKLNKVFNLTYFPHLRIDTCVEISAKEKNQYIALPSLFANQFPLCEDNVYQMFGSKNLTEINTSNLRIRENQVYCEYPIEKLNFYNTLIYDLTENEIRTTEHPGLTVTLLAYLFFKNKNVLKKVDVAKRFYNNIKNKIEAYNNYCDTTFRFEATGMATAFLDINIFLNKQILNSNIICCDFSMISTCISTAMNLLFEKYNNLLDLNKLDLNEILLFGVLEIIVENIIMKGTALYQKYIQKNILKEFYESFISEWNIFDITELTQTCNILALRNPEIEIFLFSQIIKYHNIISSNTELKNIINLYITLPRNLIIKTFFEMFKNEINDLMDNACDWNSRIHKKNENSYDFFNKLFYINENNYNYIKKLNSVILLENLRKKYILTKENILLEFIEYLENNNIKTFPNLQPRSKFSNKKIGNHGYIYLMPSNEVPFNKQDALVTLMKEIDQFKKPNNLFSDIETNRRIKAAINCYSIHSQVNVVGILEDIRFGLTGIRNKTNIYEKIKSFKHCEKSYDRLGVEAAETFNPNEQTLKDIIQWYASKNILFSENSIALINNLIQFEQGKKSFTNISVEYYYNYYSRMNILINQSESVKLPTIELTGSRGYELIAEKSNLRIDLIVWICETNKKLLKVNLDYNILIFKIYKIHGLNEINLSGLRDQCFSSSEKKISSVAWNEFIDYLVRHELVRKIRRSVVQFTFKLE